MGSADALSRRLKRRASRCPATWGLCGLCVAVWLIWLCASALPPLRGVGGDFVWARALETLFALSPGAVAQGAVWQGVTYALLHGSWAHLLVNLAGLAVTGSALERVLGARRMVALFTLLYIAVPVVGYLNLDALSDFNGYFALFEVPGGDPEADTVAEEETAEASAESGSADENSASAAPVCAESPRIMVQDVR